METTANPARIENRSWLDTYFRISARGSTVAKELLGGFTTFLVAAYIIFVNPQILSFAGNEELAGRGPSFEATLAVTCLTAGLMTLAMGLYARYPFMMAPGMGLNAAVAYQLIVGAGLTWQEAMGVILLEGVFITILMLTGFRQAMMKAVPDELKQAIAIGIGLFIALIGFVGGGFVRMSGVESAPLALGAVTTITFAVTVFGLLLTAVLEALDVRGSLVIGIISATILAIILNWASGGTAYTIPGVAVVPSGIVSTPDFSSIGAGFNFGVFAKMGVFAALLTIFSFMMSDFFDTMGTIVGVGRQAKNKEDKPVFLTENGTYPEDEARRILLVDSVGPIVGGAAGASSNTTYIESVAGVSEGARTGLASVVTGLLFLAAMFFTPLAAVIPPQATAPALIIVGFLMLWKNGPDLLDRIRSVDKGTAISIGLPAFLALTLMPFTYSITNGIGAAFILYTLLQVLQGKARNVHWMMYLASAAFTVYFLTSLIESLL